MLIAIPDGPEERSAFDLFGDAYAGHVFRLTHSGAGLQFLDLGPEDDAKNAPINITSSAPAPFHLISNFAETSFVLDGRTYASVEGFWQSLKFDDPQERASIARLAGPEAKRAGTQATYGDLVRYDGMAIRTGTWDHWQLMRRACSAKFEQNADARESLLATGERPLVHRVRRDSRVIPGVVMAEIWMQQRRRLKTQSQQ